MNRFTRGCIITALILVVLGIGTITAGYFMGGAPEVRQELEDEMVKFSHGHWSSWDMDLDEDDEHPILTDNYSNDSLAKADEITKLDIELGGGRVVIKPSDNDSFKVESQTTLQFKCYVDNGELFIEGFKGNSSLNGNDNVIYLYVPEGISFLDADISLGAGEMTIDSLDAQRLTLEAGAASVEIGSLKSGDADISIGTGAVKVSNGSILNGEFEIGLGSMEWKGSITGNLAAQCSMGSINMNLSGSEKDHNYNISCAAGAIAIGGNSYKATTDDTRLDNGADSSFDLECSMGRINISFK